VCLLSSRSLATIVISYAPSAKSVVSSEWEVMSFKVLSPGNIIQIPQLSAKFGSFTSKLLRGEKPIIYGTGEKSRDFIHIDDVTNFHMCALEKRRTKTDTQTYNVGTGERHTIKEVYVRVYIECKEIDSDVCDEIDYKPNQLDEAETTLANIDKAKEELGWQPEVSFDDGVKLTVQSLSKMMGAWNEWKKN